MTADEKWLATAAVIFTLLILFRVAPVATVCIVLGLLAVVHLFTRQDR